MDTENKLKILFVEDVPSDKDLAEMELRKEGFQFISTVVETKNDFIKALKEFKPDIIISDYSLPSFDGLQALELAKEFYPSLPFILYTGSLNEETAVDCIKAGAWDYVIKEHSARLPFAVKETLERKAKLQKLKQTEEKYQTIFESTGTATLIVEEDTTISMANTECVLLTGYTSEELIGTKWPKYVAPESLALLMKYDKIRVVTPEKAPRKYEANLVNKKGEIRSAILNIGFIKETKQRVVSILDITERKNAENALRENEEKFRLVVENIHESLIVENVEGKLVYANDGFCNMFGYSKDELMNLSLKDYTSPEDYENILKQHTDRMNGKKVTSDFIYKGLHKNGNEIWIEANVTVLKENGQIIGTQSLERDITERKNAEEELLENQQRLSLFFNQSIYGYYYSLFEKPFEWDDLTDKEGVLNYSADHQYITDINDTMLSQYGTTRESILGRPMSAFFKHDTDNAQKMRRKLFDEGFLHRDTYELKDDGSPVWFEGYYKCLYDDKNRIKGSIGIQLDITERKKAEEELRNFKLLLISSIESPKDMIILSIDKHYNYLYFNTFHRDVMARTYGKNVKLGMNLLECMTNDDDIRKAKINYDRALKGESHITIEEYGDINRHYYETRYNPIINDKNEIIGATAFSADITERKKADEALKKSKQDWQGIFNGLSHPTVILDSQHNILEINDSLREKLGNDISEIKKLKCWEIFHEPGSTCPPDGCPFEQMVLSGTAETTEMEMEAFGGFYLINCTPIFNDEGNLEKVIHIATDITERKKAEEELKSSETKYRNLIETMPEGFYRSSKEGYFIDANPALVNMLGYDSKEELMKVHIPEALYFEKNDRDDGVVYSPDFEHNTDVYRLKKKDGTEIWVEDYARYIKDDSGNILFHEGIIRDVTESLRVHNAILEAKDRAEEANKTKTNFLANMSHEIRTPLNGILGFAEILSGEMIDPEHIKYAKTILRSGKRLLESLHLILTYAKLDAEKQDINYSNVKIEDVINESMQSFQAMAKVKNLYLKSNILSADIKTKTDENFIRSILNNLVNNAIKYTNSGGVEIELSKESNNVIIKIRDTGIGIEKDKHGIIFEEFRQESEGLNRSFEGTGLGLSITKRFVELMKGNISVESEPGAGSTFIVELPVEDSNNSISIKLKKEEPNSNDYKVKNGDRSKTSILIVEDDKDNRFYIENILSGFIVDSAGDGETAIQKTKDKIFDIILMDINLGKGMDGITAVKEIRKHENYEKTPIVALTAFVLGGDKEEFLSSGCTHYLGKPFEYKQLLELIGKIITSK